MTPPLREAARRLARAPVFAATTVLSLGIGIGVATSVFSVVHALFLSPLPYANPDRLVEVWSTASPASDAPSDYLQPERLEALAERDLRFVHRLAGRGLGVALVLQDPGAPVRVQAEPVMGDWFGTLGTSAARGRTLTPQDHRPGAEPAAVVSHAFWRRHLSRDGAVGRTLNLSGTIFTVVGVMPPAFTSGETVWVPEAAVRGTVRPVAYAAVGRLREDATVEQAAREVGHLAEVQVAADSARWGGFGATATAIGQMARSGDRPALWLLSGVVGAVLLIGLSNLSSLFLVRARERSGSLAIRASLGATPWQLGRGLALEALLVGLTGSGLGLLLALWGKDVARALVAGGYAFPGEPVIGLPAVALSVGMGVLAAVAVGIEPVRRLRSLDVRELLRQGGGGATGSRSERRGRKVMVGAQVATSVVLVAVMGVLATAYRDFRSLDVGYDARRVVQALPDYELAGVVPDAQWELGRRVVERLRRHPAVADAGLWRFAMQDYPPRPESNAVTDGVNRDLSPRQRLYSYYDIEPGSLEALGIEAVRGRTFTDADGPGAPPVAVVTIDGAEAWWPGEDPLGRRIRLGRDAPWMTVVGVVESVQRLGQMGRTFGSTGRRLPLLFRPASQAGEPPAGWRAARCISCVGVAIGARAEDDPAAAAAALRSVLAAAAPHVPLRDIGVLLDRQMAAGYGRDILRAGRLVAAGVAAGILLAILGIVGVVADSVSRRTREIGVRMALGARPAHVVRTVIGESMITALGGMSAGLAALVLLHESIERLVFGYAVRQLGTGVLDPRVLTLATGAVLAVSLAAALAPARSALRVDPAVALRSE